MEVYFNAKNLLNTPLRYYEGEPIGRSSASSTTRPSRPASGRISRRSACRDPSPPPSSRWRPPRSHRRHAAPSYIVTGHIKVDDGGWDYAASIRRTVSIFVSRSAGAVTVIDATAKTRQHPDQYPGFGRMHESLPLNHGALLLVTDGTANAAHLIDPATGASVADVPTGTKPDAAAFDPASGLALVMNGKSGDVSTFIDPATHVAVATVAVGGALEFAATDGAGKAFVNVEDQNQIGVIDKALTLIGRALSARRLRQP